MSAFLPSTNSPPPPHTHQKEKENRKKTTMVQFTRLSEPRSISYQAVSTACWRSKWIWKMKIQTADENKKTAMVCKVAFCLSIITPLGFGSIVKPSIQDVCNPLKPFGQWVCLTLEDKSCSQPEWHLVFGIDLPDSSFFFFFPLHSSIAKYLFCFSGFYNISIVLQIFFLFTQY